MVEIADFVKIFKLCYRYVEIKKSFAKAIMKSQKTIIISLGGSIIAPKEGFIDINFLKKFRKLILKFLKSGYKFIVVAGGGKTCRLYQQTAEKITKVSNEDMDWLGIHSIRLNAHLLRTIFRNQAYPTVLDSPYKPIRGGWRMLIASAWKPGFSSDYDATLLAERFKIKTIINASNIAHAYDKDPSKYKNAKIIKKIFWKDFRKLVGSRWIPGMHAPFDPIAAKAAQKFKLQVIIAKGTDLKNIKNIILGKKFKGTIIL